jgi:hypothetical protein
MRVAEDLNRLLLELLVDRFRGLLLWAVGGRRGRHATHRWERKKGSERVSKRGVAHGSFVHRPEFGPSRRYPDPCAVPIFTAIGQRRGSVQRQPGHTDSQDGRRSSTAVQRRLAVISPASLAHPAHSVWTGFKQWRASPCNLPTPREAEMYRLQLSLWQRVASTVYGSACCVLYVRQSCL